MVSGVTGTAAGKQSRGIAIMNQRMVTLAFSARSVISRYSYSHVAEVTDLALVEGSSLDFLPAPEEREGDGNATSTAQTDDGYTKERVKRSDRSKVDTGQSHLNSGVEEKGV